MSDIIQIIANGLADDKDLAERISEYLQTSNPAIPATTTFAQGEWRHDDLARDLIEKSPNDPDLQSVFRFFIEAATSSPTSPLNCQLLEGIFNYFLSKHSQIDDPLARSVSLMISKYQDTLHPFFPRYLCQNLWSHRKFSFRENPTDDRPFQKELMNLIWQQIDESYSQDPSIFASDATILQAVTRFRPDLLSLWISRCHKLDSSDLFQSWAAIIDETPHFDQACLDFCSKFRKGKAQDAFFILHYLNRCRENSHIVLTLEFAKNPRAILFPQALGLGFEHFRDELLGRCLEAIQNIKSPWLDLDFSEEEYRKLFELAAANWDTHGRDLIAIMLASSSNYSFLHQVSQKKLPLRPIAYPVLRDETLIRTRKLKGADLTELWQAALAAYPKAFKEDLWELLASKSKGLRSAAATALASSGHPSLPLQACEALQAKKADTRLGAIALLKLLGEPSIETLRTAHSSEKSQKVQEAMEEALGSLGAKLPSSGAQDSTEDLLTQIESDKRVKLPAAQWFDLAKFPLVQKDGTLLPEKSVIFLIQKQSKHKTIDAAPGILPVLELLDSGQNSDAALALLNQWLDSDQVAKDRWALVLAGLLGDNRIITALTPRIQPWCENSRHKLAEYAAQAISLLATEEALMILDTLANRYRSKFKNIGKACTAAFLAAAEARGVSPDELGDLVVPNLGFNSECHKEFDDGKIIAVLQPDFKITWLNSETEKETKSPPSNLSDEGKEELKTLRKILREAIKGQTARFEQMLVRQRRWPVARWQELFEEHPLLQSYAAILVWGVYNSNSELLRTFRRYPNGILANGSGEMEDLEERDTEIGLVHPLQLDDDSLTTWRDHLGRFKVKQPFLQIDRPIELIEEGHGNRREITFTDKLTISYGTFIGRLNRMSWTRGSIIDAGGVCSYYKAFQSTGVEAVLNLEECWIGMDPMDEVSLGNAAFAKIASIERGSYVYDEPSLDDPRVLSFNDVPAIVYSETISDLKSLIAGQSK